MKKAHRSRRGRLSESIRGVIFKVFRSKNLPFVNSATKPNEIREWKNSAVLKECYEILHSRGDDDNTWYGRVIEIVFPDISKAPPEQVAFTVSLCEFFLNPNNEDIKNDEAYLRVMTKKNKVS